MTIPDIGYLIASKYNIILVCLSLKQNITIFPLCTAPPTNASLHRLLCIGHVYDSHFVQVRLLLNTLFIFLCLLISICGLLGHHSVILIHCHYQYEHHHQSFPRHHLGFFYGRMMSVFCDHDPEIHHL